MLESSGAEEHNGGRKVQSVLWAVVIHVAMIVLFTLIVILPAIRDEPEIVAEVASAGPEVDPKKQKRSVTKQVEKSSPASSASPIARLMRANATAVIAAPKVKKISDGPIGLGEGDFGDGGFGSGSGGFGSGVSFFGARASKANNILFVLDYSQSVKSNQRAMIETEMERALKGLSGGVKYQVILFAGPVWFPGWNVSGGKDNPTVTNPDKKGSAWKFTSVKGAQDFKFEGSDAMLPKDNWLTANAANIKHTMEKLRSTKLVWGTDWGMAMDVAHRMDPPPKVIFFMADGTGGNSPPPILATNAKFGNPKINTLAMQTTSGAAQFHEIAEETGGEFRIIMGANKTVSGKDYFKDKGKYDSQIKGRK